VRDFFIKESKLNKINQIKIDRFLINDKEQNKILVRAYLKNKMNYTAFKIIHKYHFDREDNFFKFNKNFIKNKVLTVLKFLFKFKIKNKKISKYAKKTSLIIKNKDFSKIKINLILKNMSKPRSPVEFLIFKVVTVFLKNIYSQLRKYQNIESQKSILGGEQNLKSDKKMHPPPKKQILPENRNEKH
jgi:hypothetical protein